MNVIFLALLVLLLSWTDSLQATQAATEAEEGHYLNEWAVEIRGGERQARAVADRHGYTLVRALKSFPDHYILTHEEVPTRSRRTAVRHTARLTEDGQVSFVAQQKQVYRAKRDVLNLYAADRDVARSKAVSGAEMDDPQGTSEWYINKYTTATGCTTLGVRESWQKGYTGRNISVTILDDGIEKDHPDLKANYDPEASYDLNDNDNDPTPRYEPTNENKHGTRCAGEVAMVADNGYCGTGIAFDAKIGGVRMLDGKVTDSLEGEAMSYNHKHVDIYSASWGPNDDGKTTEGPQALAAKGLKLGIEEGRGGKGSIYVWASGNGGGIGDNCNSDGYTSSIFTLSVSSASENGHSPWYSEKCSSTVATTYSSGGGDEGKVTSADLHGKCTNNHSGTSAAAPMAAGLVALLLSANSELTWRDVQHITIHSARMAPLAGEHGWYKNGAGYCVNLAFGFGLMNAANMIDLGTQWVNVEPQHVCRVVGENDPKVLMNGHEVEVLVNTTGCKGQDNEVNFLEHVQVVLDMDYTRRGDIYVELESPMGTITPLMLTRKYDTSTKGFKQWPLMSVHTWGETAEGIWKVRIADTSTRTNNGTVNSVQLVMMGTKNQPQHQQGGIDVGCNAPEKKMNVEVDGDDTAVKDPNVEAQELLRNLADGLQKALGQNNVNEAGAGM